MVEAVSDGAGQGDGLPEGPGQSTYGPPDDVFLTSLEPGEAEGRRVSRRALIGGGIALVAGTAAYRWFEGRYPDRPALPAPGTRPVGFDGRPVTLMAMHLHASFSEGKASYLKHFTEAAANQIDIVWFTEHDWRMSAVDYRSEVHFDSLSGDDEEDESWSWVESPDPNLASYLATIVTSPVSPHDPSTTPGALLVSAVSGDGQAASNRVAASTGESRDNYRGNVGGQTITFDVFPTSVGPDAWLEFRLELSDLPRIGDRAAGTYVLSYQLSRAKASSTAQGQLGIVTIPVRTNEWNTVTVRPEIDIAALWPDLLAQDNATYQLWLGATSSAKGVPSEGVFDYLRFHRSGRDANAPLVLQEHILAHYRPQFPAVTAYGGLEVSFFEDHMTQYGGQFNLAQLSALDTGNVRPAKTSLPTPGLAARIRTNGGFSCLNHPLALAGPSTERLTQLQQDIRRRSATDTLLDAKVYGLDMVEVGYEDRGGMLFDAHFQLACSLWRNSLFVTANGASDDHNATGYSSIVNRFHTGVFPVSNAQDDLLAELGRGHAFVSLLQDGPTVMDLRLDDNPMGSVSVQPPNQRTVRFLAERLPAGGSMEIVRGTVDDAGTSSLDPELSVVAAQPVRDPSRGELVTPVDASTSAFFLARVKDSDGHVVGFTNPCWALTAPPPGGVPAGRRAPDTTV